MCKNEAVKKCARCELSLPLNQFYNNSRSLDGKGSYCKECARIAQREAREKKELEKYKLKQIQKEREILLQKKVEEISSSKKHCSRCKELKPLNHFHRNSKNKDGRDSICIECRKKREAENILKRLEKRGY